MPPWSLGGEWGGFWGQVGHHCHRDAGPRLVCVTRSPVPNTGTVIHIQHSRRARVACRWMHGVLKHTCLPAPKHPLHARKRVGGCSFSYWATVKGRVSLVDKYTCLVFILAHSSGQILAWNYFQAQCYLSWGPLLQTFARDNPCKLIGAGVTNAGRRQKLMDCRTFLHLKDFAIVVVHTQNRSKQTYAHMVIFLHTHMHAYTYLYLHFHLYLYMCVYISSH